MEIADLSAIRCSAATQGFGDRHATPGCALRICQAGSCTVAAGVRPLPTAIRAGSVFVGKATAPLPQESNAAFS